jgi:hypothetical protein
MPRHAISLCAVGLAAQTPRRVEDDGACTVGLNPTGACAHRRVPRASVAASSPSRSNPVSRAVPLLLGRILASPASPGPFPPFSFSPFFLASNYLLRF